MSADTQIKSIYERWERLEGEKKAISDDLKELFAESKLAGYDGKALRIAFNRKAKMDAATTADEHFDAVVDTYLDALNGHPRDARMHTRENKEEFDPISGEFLEDGEAVGIASDLPTNTRSEGGLDGVAPFFSLAARETDESAASNSPEQATEKDASADGVTTPSIDSVEPGILAEDTRSDANTGGEDVDSSAPRAGQADQTSNIGEGERELINALPGTLTRERDPSVPMRKAAFAHCFPELSKAEYLKLRDSIIAIGISDPVIRKGDVILDGWCRYDIARSIGIHYPVFEYDGSDELIDVIYWQRSSRDWTPQQEAKIAKALAAEVPARAEEIFAAFHIALNDIGEVVAA